LPEAAAELRRRTNGNAAVVVHNVALGDTSGQVPFFWHHEHSQSSSMLATTARNEAVWPQTRPQRVVSVPMTTLDSVMAGREWEPDLLVKMDVQGWECAVLSGAARMVAERRVRFVVSEVGFSRLDADMAYFSDLHSIMEKSGYIFCGLYDNVRWGPTKQFVGFANALYCLPADV